MLKNVVLAVIASVAWVVITGRASFESLLVGFGLGLILAVLIRFQRWEMKLSKLPLQLLSVFIYSLVLSRDIMLSSVDVARRALSPNMPLNPGIIAVKTQDEEGSRAVSALSAHGITITPGELVVDFDGADIMYVHVLDVENAERNAAKNQAKRLGMYRRMLGRD
jgi:multicomponent Na+:H+ antiporter subunit E